MAPAGTHSPRYNQAVSTWWITCTYSPMDVFMYISLPTVSHTKWCISVLRIWKVYLLKLQCSHIAKDPSFTLPNLTSVLDKLPDKLWKKFGKEADVPNSILHRIERQFHTDGERKAELLRVCVTEHPEPTWERISDALYRCNNEECHRTLDIVQSKFPTGESLIPSSTCFDPWYTRVRCKPCSVHEAVMLSELASYSRSGPEFSPQHNDALIHVGRGSVSNSSVTRVQMGSTGRLQLENF